MSFSADYHVSYAVTYASGSITLGTETAAFAQVIDDGDGADDGRTPPGYLMVEAWTYGFCTLVGTAAEGVVILDTLGDYHLLTDQTGLSGSLTVDTTTLYTYCYLAGTAIRTPTGERAVETIRRGDLVSTHDGRAVAVRWIGTQVRDARVARLSGGMPVRVRAGALGTDADGTPVPVRDLCVSPDHALLVDGLLIHAEALVNGTSIVRVRGDELEQVAYFHIETEHHELIVADGAPAETFIDNADRARFDNHAEWLALYPDAPAMRELPLGRVKLARQVPKRVAERLARIAAGLAVADAQRFHRGGARVA